MSGNNLEPSEANVLSSYNAVTLTMRYLKVLHDMSPQYCSDAIIML